MRSATLARAISHFAFEARCLGDVARLMLQRVTEEVRKMRKWLLAIAAGFVSFGCGGSTRYVLSPTDQVTERVAGRPASRYSVPPEAPRGSVTVTSFGVVEVAPQPGADRVPALDVRFVVTNDDDTSARQMDTRSERLSLPGLPELQSAFVSAGVPGSPTVVVPPGQARTMDFFYTLPEQMETTADIPGCDVTWAVKTPSRVVAGRTPFERVALAPVYYGYPYEYGPYYPYPYGYYDPLWPGMRVYFGFGHRRW